MGRYTTVQTFTDQDAKAAISYSTATSSGGGSGGGGVKASHYGPGNTTTTASSSSASTSGHGESRAAINRVDNVSGSSAGAGSGDFHMYRASRRRCVSDEQPVVVMPVRPCVFDVFVNDRLVVCVVAALVLLLRFDSEMERVERMEQDYARRKAQEEFERKRQSSVAEFEARVHKRAEKRRRRKERTKARALDGSEEDAEDPQGEGGAEKNEKKGHKRAKTEEEGGKETVLETPGGVPEIPNDGNFLARMLAEQQKRKETAKPDSKPKEKHE
ncbi:hypothetical protein PybrP1_000702 [[Pythium] brassicae (nom. inval.)]|nr:hypothetical protein PybrP1_000702 [[Pythium] brassicae (nom. inval.)]